MYEDAAEGAGFSDASEDGKFPGFGCDSSLGVWEDGSGYGLFSALREEMRVDYDVDAG